MTHFMTVLKTFRPSLQKDAVGIVSLQPVLWSDIGGLDEVKMQIKQVGSVGTHYYFYLTATSHNRASRIHKPDLHGK